MTDLTSAQSSAPHSDRKQLVTLRKTTQGLSACSEPLLVAGMWRLVTSRSRFWRKRSGVAQQVSGTRLMVPGGRHVQRVVKSLGRRDEVEASGTLDALIASVEAEETFHSSSLAPSTGRTIRSLADLAPRTLAIMHGSSMTGAGTTDALRSLANFYDARVRAALQ